MRISELAKIINSNIQSVVTCLAENGFTVKSNNKATPEIVALIKEKFNYHGAITEAMSQSLRKPRKKSKTAEDSKIIEDLRMLIEVSGILFTQRDIDSILDTVLHKLKEIVNAERSTLYLLNRETGELWYRVVEDEKIEKLKLPVGKGIAGYVAKTKEIVNIKDAYADSRFNPEVDKVSGFITKNILCVPLVNHIGNVLGVIQILNKREGFFTEYDESLIKTFSYSIASCIDNANIYKELDTILKSLIKSISRVIDSKFPLSSSHSERVAKYALKFGEVLNFDDITMKNLELAAYLHDIGKLGINNPSLYKFFIKPSESNEYAIFKDHILIGNQLLRDVQFPEMFSQVPKIVACHHERYDGTGFPDKLKHDSIPLLSRILAVIDTYDLLTSSGTFSKSAMSEEEAIKFLIREKGAGFDPRIVDTFINKKLFHFERRQFKRFDMEFSIQFSPLKEDHEVSQNLTSNTINISAGGLLFRIDNYLPPNTYLETYIQFPESTLYAIARIVRCDKKPFGGGYDVALQFLNLSETVQKRLDKYLTDLRDIKIKK